MIDGYEQFTFEEIQVFTLHEQVKVHAPDGTPIIVDKELARLLESLWKLGYETVFSCQGSKLNESPSLRPCGYIYFATDQMVNCFYEKVNQEFPRQRFPFYEEPQDIKPIIKFSLEAIPLFEKTFCDTLVVSE